MFKLYKVKDNFMIIHDNDPLTVRNVHEFFKNM